MSAREAGTTRDSVMAKASVYPEGQYDADGDPLRQDFWLVDTAGVKDAVDDFEFTIQEQIAQAADSADVIWVVVEANVPITEEDRRVAKMALKSKKPVFLIINKLDKAKKSTDLTLFDRLGIKTIVRASAMQNTGIDEIITKLLSVIPKGTENPDDNRLRIALLGRPNVGKSQLFNTLAKKQQAIVADRAGTTRDVNRAIVRYQEREIELMDTAGIRRSGKIEVGIERFSVIRAIAAIEEADVCFLLMDVNELHVQLDQKIAGMIKDAGKAWFSSSASGTSPMKKMPSPVTRSRRRSRMTMTLCHGRRLFSPALSVVRMSRNCLTWLSKSTPPVTPS